MGGGLGGGFRSNKAMGRKQKGKIPMNNQAQNKQTNDVARELKLTPKQARELHDEVSGEGYGYHEILQIAKDMFDK
ncbi:MAG: hypothetical protein ACK5K7_06630 [Bacilli bacterium]